MLLQFKYILLCAVYLCCFFHIELAALGYFSFNLFYQQNILFLDSLSFGLLRHLLLVLFLIDDGLLLLLAFELVNPDLADGLEFLPVFLLDLFLHLRVVVSSLLYHVLILELSFFLRQTYLYLSCLHYSVAPYLNLLLNCLLLVLLFLIFLVCLLLH